MGSPDTGRWCATLIDSTTAVRYRSLPLVAFDPTATSTYIRVTSVPAPITSALADSGGNR